jgi:hypothetical protein
MVGLGRAEPEAAVTNRCRRSHRGRTRIKVATIARSGQSNRGLGLARRGTATSWRSTSSSTSFRLLHRAHVAEAAGSELPD